MSKMIRWIGLLLLLWACGAQAATYAYRNDVFSYDTPSASANVVTWHATGAAPACTNYPLGDDDYADVVFANGTTPANNFTFTFAGVAQTGVRIYSNGILAFGNDTSGFWRTYNNTSLPITASAGAYAGCSSGVPSKLISAYWNDIVAGTGNNTVGAAVKYELLGTAPNRRLVISWVNVKLYGQTARYNFQIILYESPAGGLNSNFKYQYTTGSSDGSDATVGVQVSTTDSALYSFNQAFIDPVAGSAILWYPSNQLAGKNAEYRFDESTWNGTAGEVKDTSGSGLNAVRVGAASSVANGAVCRAGSFTSNISNATIDAVATPITPASVGSVDFWFNSNAKWNSADAMLFDATTTAAKPFFLMKRSTGALRFVVTDSAGTVLATESASQSFAAGSWHHVGVSWNLRPGTNQTLLQIFLDGVLVNTLRTTSSGSIMSLSSLYIGDNRTSGVTPSTGSPNGANGIIDELNVYATEINASQAAADKNSTHTCAAVDHFHIIHNGSAVTCDVAPVTIEAHDINHALVALSGVTLNLSTSLAHGNWSNITGGSVNPVTNNGNGSGSYVFSNESSVTFGLQDPATAAESLTIGASSGTVSNTSGAGAICVPSDYTFGSTCNTPLAFALAGFRFVDGAGNPIGNQLAGVSYGAYYLQAIKQGTTTGACSALFPAGTAANIDLAFECNNPLSCQTGQAFTLTPGTGAGTAGAIAANANGAVSATTGSYTTKALIFNASAPAPAVPFSFSYSDVGQIRLWARYTPSGGATVLGSSQFVVAPKSFAFSAITAAPIKAGATFSATVTAMNGATTPAATPNFGKETAPEGVKLSHALVAPSGGAAGALSIPAFSTFNSGATTASMNWSEVGTIALTANLANPLGYLGTGLTATGTSGTIGRFMPDHFAVVTPATFAAGCVAGSFTYMDQAFTLNAAIEARNAADAKTQNYIGSYATGVVSYQMANNGISIANTRLGGLGTPTWSTGSYPFTANNFSRLAAPDGPYDALAIGVSVTDETALAANQRPYLINRNMDASNASCVADTAGTSNGTCPAVKLSTARMRFGRLKISNAHGSELLNLPVPLVTQFWNGNAFVTNTDDSCTSVVMPVLTIGGTVVASTVNNPFVSGNGGLRLTRPNVRGVVDFTIPASNWLQYPWKGAARIDPAARATFGIYKGSGNVIYMREN